MLIIAHRGAHQHHPENSHAAFEQAVRDGAHGIETDVRITRDGALVLFHDRVLADGRAVAALTHRELSSACGFPVPTLEEALSRHDVLWNVELKARAALDPVLDVMERYRDQRRLLLTSFCHPAILQAASVEGIDRGLLVAHEPSDVPSLVRALDDCGARALVIDYETFEPGLVNAVQAVGMDVLAYDVRTEAEVLRCAQHGMYAVITDFVGMAKIALRRHGHG